MNNAIVSKNALQPSLVIRLGAIKLVAFSAVFTALSVAAPWLAHQFGIAGQVFLPMHLFVFIAALLFGWPAGIIVGLFTPIMSYLISGMPALSILPVIAVEIIAYGLIAGFLRGKMQLNLYASLIGALVLGKLFLGMGAFIVLGSDPIFYIRQAVYIGWPGIVLQILLIPFIVKFIQSKFISQN